MANEREIRIVLPEFSLVVLIGASGSGKSTFAQIYFLPTEVLSSDFFRALVSDDENSLEEYLTRKKPILLTDDYVPTDILAAALLAGEGK